MTFKDFLQLQEAGTQGEGPTASGQRGSSLISPSTYQAPKLSQKAKGGPFGGSGNESLGKVSGGPFGGGGIGQLAPPRKPGLMGAGKYEPMKPSPFSSTLKYSPPQNLDWPKKASK